MPRRTSLRKSVARYELAIGLTGLALTVRYALAPQSQTQPLATFFVAVVLCAFLTGPGPTLTAAVLGYVAAEWFFIGPRNAFGPHTPADWARVTTYLATCGIVVVGSTRLARARDRAEAEVAERKLAEARADSLARFPEENPDPVIRLGSDLTVVYANDAARSILLALHVQVGSRVPELDGAAMK